MRTVIQRDHYMKTSHLFLCRSFLSHALIVERAIVEKARLSHDEILAKISEEGEGRETTEYFDW